MNLYWEVVDIYRGERNLESMLATLSANEHARADRYRHERDRVRFVVVRAQLRALLAERLDRSPIDIALATTDLGKPFIKNVNHLFFNVSHAEEFSVIAIAGKSVGVDIEKRLPMDLRSVLPEVAAGDEARSVMAASRPEVAFYRMWTRKEAVLKAVGSGFSVDARSFAVTCSEHPALSSSQDSRICRDNLTLCDIEVPNGYAGALCVLD